MAQHKEQRSAVRRSSDCTPNGCEPVVMSNTKLTWVLRFICIFGTTGCGLLAGLLVMQMRALPELRRTLVAQFNEQKIWNTQMDARVKSVEFNQLHLRDRIYILRGVR